VETRVPRQEDVQSDAVRGPNGAWECSRKTACLRCFGSKGFASSSTAASGRSRPTSTSKRGDGEAKLWLQPVELVYSYRLTPSELRRVRELTFQHEAAFVERWNEHFSP
jgi:hypothetical protein